MTNNENVSLSSSPIEIINDLWRADSNQITWMVENINQWSGISETLSKLKFNSYIEWIFFIAWTAALILLMYNGIRLLVGSGLGNNEYQKVKGRVINLSIWVIIIAGVYAILKIIMSVLGQVIW